MKKIFAVFMAILWLITAGGCAPGQPKVEPKGVTVLDSRGEVIFQSKQEADIHESLYWAYLDVALDEAAQLVSMPSDSTLQQCREQLFVDGYTLHTVFDAEVFRALQKGINRWDGTLETGCAVTDLQGNLLAVYSSDSQNYAKAIRSPYSTMKPLSVYTPAVEQGIANWSALYMDEPYKTIKDENGNDVDWPANDSGVYSREQVPVYEALRKSLNTVAVHCLSQVGVSKSIAFLQDKFAMALKEEEYVVETYGEEEVIGNIALGYLETGLTPMDMAGYYQVFANGGNYVQPKAVAKIEDAQQQTVYSRSIQVNQVISPATADVMNKLLQGVVTAGGTGKAAACRNVEVAGKTGTGDAFADNWFVGVTPAYSLAVWHGKHEENQADEMFSSVVEKLYEAYPQANRKFINHQSLYQVIYCTHSGMAFSDNCTTIEMGYFAESTLPVCDVCQRKGGQ